MRDVDVISRIKKMDIRLRNQSLQTSTSNKLQRIKNNLFVRAEIEKRIGHNTALLDIVLQRKLSFYGHISRHDNLCKTIMQGYVEGKRNRGRPKRNWMNDLTEYTFLSLGNLLEKPWNRDEWKKLCYGRRNVLPLRCSTSRD